MRTALTRIGWFMLIVGILIAGLLTGNIKQVLEEVDRG